MEHANVLTLEMIEAANGIYLQLDDWQSTDRALMLLRKSLPGFTFEEILLKSLAINTLYGTFVYAIWKTAKHIHRLMKDVDPESVSVEFVEEIAKVPETKRRLTSFASKFAHFFINEELFPIKDNFAEVAIRKHLGQINLFKCPEKPYFEYVTNFTNLKIKFGYNGQNRVLDRYLWLAGQFKTYQDKKDKAEINQEVKEFFESSNNKESILRAFKGKP